MKKSKLFIVTVLMTLCSLVSFSQEKLETKAADLVKEMSQKLEQAKAEKLNAEQEKQLVAIYTEKLTEIKKIRKEVADKDEQKVKIKEVNKKTSKRVFDEVLTKEQKAALKANKKQADNNN